jgi:proteasome beta subunit
MYEVLKMNEERLKTGTTTVGIVCKDGIILAADKRATAGHMIAQKDADKVHKIADNIAVTIAGTVSDAQYIIRLMKSEIQLKSIRTGLTPSVKETANLLARVVFSNIRRPSMIPGIAHFILAGKDETGFYLYDIYPDGSISLHKDFVSSGSGSVMAYGVLETLYKECTIEEGIDLTIKCINAAISRDSASGNGIDIFTITDKGAERVFKQEIPYKIVR